MKRIRDRPADLVIVCFPLLFRRVSSTSTPSVKCSSKVPETGLSYSAVFAASTLEDCFVVRFVDVFVARLGLGLCSVSGSPATALVVWTAAFLSFGGLPRRFGAGFCGSSLFWVSGGGDRGYSSESLPVITLPLRAVAAFFVGFFAAFFGSGECKRDGPMSQMRKLVDDV